MKIIPLILLIILGIFVMTSTASAGEVQLKSYYNDYLTKKIDCCRQTAGRFNACYNSRIYDLTKMRAEQADFYEKNRRELVDTMFSSHLGKQTHRMDYFLLNEFKIRRHLAGEIR